MKIQSHMQGRNGFSLVELLVVIMIITVLAVGALVGFRSTLVKASYGANVIPTLSLLRTKIEAYRLENGFLPGLQRNAQGIPVTTVLYPYGASKLGANDTFGTYGLQGFFKGKLAGTTALDTYKESIVTALAGTGTKDALATWEDSVTSPTWTPEWNLSDHFARCIDVNYSDLTAPKSWPNYYQYAAYAGGYSGGYCYVVAGFSDGRGGMPVGTGVVFLEYDNTDPNVMKKGTLKWERYKATGNHQICMAIGDDGFALPQGFDWKEAGYVHIPLVMNSLMSSTPGTVEAALEALREYGWVTP